MIKVITFVLLAGLALIASANPLLDSVTHALAQKQHHTTRIKTAPTETQRYAVVLFFRSTCPHCRRFTPVIKAVAHHFHLHVYAYSTDGGALPAYPTPLMATPAIRRLFFQGIDDVVPTVFIINTQTMGFHVVAQGEISAAVLAHDLQPYQQDTP